MGSLKIKGGYRVEGEEGFERREGSRAELSIILCEVSPRDWKKSRRVRDGEGREEQEEA